MLNKRLNYLDSIRGMAAFLVFLYHSFNHWGITFNSVDLGRIGVVVFFYMSGLVIPWSMVLKKSDYPIKTFIIKRFLRLFPVYWFSIILACICINVIPDIDWHSYGLNYISPIQVLTNFTMLQRVFLLDDVIGVYWTLFVELIFYFFCVVFLFSNFINNSKISFIITLAFLFIGFVFSLVNNLYMIKLPIIVPVSLSIMFYGTLYKNFLIDKNKKSIIYLLFSTFLKFIFLYMIFVLNYGDGYFKWFFTYLISFLFFMAFTLYIKFENDFFVYFGKISYSFYLLHSIIIAVVFNFFDLNNFTVISVITSVFFSFTLTFILSHFSYLYVEIYFSKLISDKLSYFKSVKLF